MFPQLMWSEVLCDQNQLIKAMHIPLQVTDQIMF